MKLCFFTTLFLLDGCAFAEDLRGSMVEENMDLMREAANMAGVASMFESGIQPAQIKRVKELKASLLPMFETLPKNKHGKLVPQVARYVLHRLFEQQHSWFVEGLAPGNSTANIFDQLSSGLSSVGISMNNLALLAMVIEDRVHQEASAQVTSSYVAMHQRPWNAQSGGLNAREMDQLVERYLTIYISGMRSYNLTESELRAQWNFMQQNTTDWDETLRWMRAAEADALKKQKQCQGSHGVNDCSYDLQSSTDVVEEVVKNYGAWNNGECKRLKSTLLELEDRKTGRVNLADFYKKGLTGTWQFNEKVDYLRDLGTLDESVPGQPRVIVANYVSSYVNCLTASDVYSVCCSNECEGLMGHLERNTRSPTASPERILELVRSFRSDDVVAPTDIPKLQQDRLVHIASKHDAKVPLHGRLFAQWLHHIFPQSCPFPHAAGATNPMTPDEWMKAKGHGDIQATQEEMSKCIQTFDITQSGAVHNVKAKDSDDDDAQGKDSMHWIEEENSVFVTHHEQLVVPATPLWRSNGLVTVIQVLTLAGIFSALKKYAKVFRPDKTAFEKHII